VIVTDLVGFAIPVRLSDDDLALVRSHARAVEANARRRNWQHKWPADQDMSAVQVRGFSAEKAVAKATGLRWNRAVLGHGYSTLRKRPDVGARVEVRCSPYELWSKANDDRDWLYVHVTARAFDLFVLDGWVEARELLVPAYYREGSRGRPGGYALPKTDLRPFPLPEDA
jgi:hypothetical protein